MKRIIAILMILCTLGLAGCSIGSSQGNFKFTKETYPKMGGSPSAELLGKAIAATAIGSDINSVDSLVDFSTTTAEAYEALCDGKLDILIAYEPDAKTLSYIKKSGKSVEYTPIAADALVMICSSENEVDSLTENQLSGIYSGRIKTWSEFGGKEIEILPYQSESGSGEQELFDRTLNMGDRLETATKEIIVSSSGELLTAASKYDNSEKAIGYATYHDMQLIIEGLSGTSNTVKILSVDGISPSLETIESGEYTLTEKLYVAVRKNSLSGSPERVLYNWICSEQGKELIKQQKYVSVSN